MSEITDRTSLSKGPIWCGRCRRTIATAGASVCPGGHTGECQGYPCPDCGEQHKWNHGPLAQPATEETLLALRRCAACWEPGVCLLGNVRAREIIAAIDDVRAQLAARDAQIAALRDALDAASEHIPGRIVTRDVGRCRVCDGHTHSGMVQTCRKCIREVVNAALAATPDAALAEVRREERERCAKAAEAEGQRVWGQNADRYWQSQRIAGVIRALSAEREGDVSNGR